MCFRKGYDPGSNRGRSIFLSDRAQDATSAVRVESWRRQNELNRVHRFFSTVENLSTWEYHDLRNADFTASVQSRPQTPRDHGLTIDIEAQRHDIDGLVDAIRRFFEKR